MKSFNDVNALANEITKRASTSGTFVVAVDGFGGSGKSTLCKKLRVQLKDCRIICIDDYIIYPHAPNEFHHDWEYIEQKVLKALKNEQKVPSKTYDWKSMKPVIGETVDVKNIMLVDGLRTLDSNRGKYYDLKIWVDYPYEIALERGKKRDRQEQGMDHDHLWDTVWGPGMKEYYEITKPYISADFLYISGI